MDSPGRGEFSNAKRAAVMHRTTAESPATLPANYRASADGFRYRVCSDEFAALYLGQT
jgi:hypothetical protein